MTLSEQSNSDWCDLEEMIVELDAVSDELRRSRRIRLSGLVDHVARELRDELVKDSRS